MRSITKIFSTYVVVLSVFAAARAPEAEATQGHLSGLQARITLADGIVRMARLEGLGCTSAICSRVALKGKVSGAEVKFWLDRIALMRPINEDEALVVMKDGAEQRLTLVTDFRVLYLGNQNRGSEKLDLARIQSIEFIPPGK
jgi:hypothetical protein